LFHKSKGIGGGAYSFMDFQLVPFINFVYVEKKEIFRAGVFITRYILFF